MEKCAKIRLEVLQIKQVRFRRLDVLLLNNLHRNTISQLQFANIEWQKYNFAIVLSARPPHRPLHHHHYDRARSLRDLLMLKVF